jgi:hypothetical protein
MKRFAERLKAFALLEKDSPCFHPDRGVDIGGGRAVPPRCLDQLMGSLRTPPLGQSFPDSWSQSSPRTQDGEAGVTRYLAKERDQACSSQIHRDTKGIANCTPDPYLTSPPKYRTGESSWKGRILWLFPHPTTPRLSNTPRSYTKAACVCHGHRHVFLSVLLSTIVSVPPTDGTLIDAAPVWEQRLSEA